MGDICKELFCPPNSECVKRKRQENQAPYYDCDCLPQFTRDNDTGDCIFQNEDIRFTGADGTSYTDWEIGPCNGECGLGSGTDTRSCKAGNCTDELERKVECRLPNACLYNN